MLTTRRKPATVGEILIEEFMQPMALTQAALAEAMGVQRTHVKDLCNDRRTVTAAALILARVFGNSPDFCLNVRRRRARRRDLCGPKDEGCSGVVCFPQHTTPGVRGSVPKWRRGWDSNPRYPYGYNGFRDRPDRPLRHLSRRPRLIGATAPGGNARPPARHGPASSACTKA